MCTRATVFNLKHKILLGLILRLMDFASITGKQYALFKAGIKIKSDCYDGEVGTTLYDFKAKFSDIGFKFLGKHYGARTISDGLNEHGLSFATLWNACSQFDTHTKMPADCISALDVPKLTLGTCKNIEEAKKLFGCQKIPYINRRTGEEEYKFVGTKRVNMPTEMAESFATIHLHLSDRTGASVVVEFETIDGKAGVPVFYDDPFGVLTNAPDFPYHQDNLRNYVGAVDKFNVTKATIMGQDYNTTGFGNNWRGVPADYQPTSRYVRAVLMKNAMLEQHVPETVKEGIKFLDYIKGTVQVPKGVSANHGTLSPDIDWTQWTTIHDVFNFKIYQESDTECGYTELFCEPLKSLEANMLALDGGIIE